MTSRNDFAYCYPAYSFVYMSLDHVSFDVSLLECHDFSRPIVKSSKKTIHSFDTTSKETKARYRK
jgi:hypothetical protein